jgi:hypothetical protein
VILLLFQGRLVWLQQPMQTWDNISISWLTGLSVDGVYMLARVVYGMFGRLALVLITSSRQPRGFNS